jgi:hypothetical protein
VIRDPAYLDQLDQLEHRVDDVGRGLQPQYHPDLLALFIEPAETGRGRPELED